MTVSAHPHFQFDTASLPTIISLIIRVFNHILEYSIGPLNIYGNLKKKPINRKIPNINKIPCYVDRNIL